MLQMNLLSNVTDCGTEYQMARSDNKIKALDALTNCVEAGKLKTIDKLSVGLTFSLY